MTNSLIAECQRAFDEYYKQHGHSQPMAEWAAWRAAWIHQHDKIEGIISKWHSERPV